MPKVSVIMPAYNAAQTIQKAIASVHAQGIPDVEIVIADDCSTDGTRGLLRGLATKDPALKVLELEKNGGAGVARNAALDAATGEWVALLDADDWFEPPRLSAMLKTAADFNADVVYDNLKIFDPETGQTVDRTRFGNTHNPTVLTAETFIDNDNVLLPYGMGYLQPLIKRAFLEPRHLRYDVNHRISEDFLFELEIFLKGAKGAIIPQAYYVYLQRQSLPADVKSLLNRARPGHSEAIIRGCDEMLAKYGASMTAPERKALRRRRYIFESRMECDNMIMALRKGEIKNVIQILAARPHILVLNFATLKKVLRNKIRNLLRSRRR